VVSSPHATNMHYPPACRDAMTLPQRMGSRRHSCIRGTLYLGLTARIVVVDFWGVNTTVSGFNLLRVSNLRAPNLSLRLGRRKVASYHRAANLLSQRPGLDAMILRHRMELRLRSCISGTQSLDQMEKIAELSFLERIIIVLRFYQDETIGRVRAVLLCILLRSSRLYPTLQIAPETVDASIDLEIIASIVLLYFHYLS
jgi:hypothetical protein